MDDDNDTKFPDETPLDSYEMELKVILDKGEFKSASKKEFEATKKMFEAAAKNHIKLRKSKRG